MAGITDYDFNEIVSKAEVLRRLIDKIERKLSEESFSDLPKEVYEVLANYEFAPLIATICDWGIYARDAWSIPCYFFKKIGSLDAKVIVSQDISAILKNYFDSDINKEERQEWISKTSADIKEALEFFIREGTNPIKIFVRPENPEFRAMEVYFTLRRIKGIGFKKANMIVRDFIYRSRGLFKRHPWFDQIKAISPDFKIVGEEETFVPIDVHIVKVFNRIFGRKYSRYGWKKEQEEHWWDLDIQMFSKLVFSEFPARLDLALWYIGKEFCDNNWKLAKCSECPVNIVCDSRKI